MNETPSIIVSLQQQILNPLITLIALAAFLYFLWGLVQFIQAGATGSTLKDEGKRHMLWGVIGLAIIFGARAILALMSDIVGR